MTTSHRIGLANLGNTCFMNAVFQALRHSPEFLTFVWKRWNDYPHHEIRQVIAKELRTLYTRMLGAPPSHTVIEPRQFLAGLLYYIREGYVGHEKTPGISYVHREQLDADEFLVFILDSIHECMKRKVEMTIHPGAGEDPSVVTARSALASWVGFYEKKFSPITEHFTGQNETSRTCKKCKTVRCSYEPWLVLNVQIALPTGVSSYSGAKIPTLEECLHSYYKTTDTEETGETLTCETCKERTHYIETLRPIHIPTNFMIALKRFTWDNRKIRGAIPFDLDCFDVAPFLTHESPYTSVTQTKYRTYAIVEQGGMTRGGHYVSYGRQIDRWIRYDDSSSAEVPPSSVITPDSYVIFMTNNPDYTSFHTDVYPTYRARAVSLIPAP
jgi:ubiquitin C-terminal hydrolase